MGIELDRLKNVAVRLFLVLGSACLCVQLSRWCSRWSHEARGIPVLFFLNVAAVLFLAAMVLIQRTLLSRPSMNLFGKRVLLVAGSFLLATVAAEGILFMLCQHIVASRDAALAIPPDWRREPVALPGTIRAERWHGHLHVYDANRMRRVGPFPEKRVDCSRIVVLGDSLTYGMGVSSSETYASQLEELLSTSGNIEVLNLGVCGHHSEDTLDVLGAIVPGLEPDLVIYGVCLNDFLPSGVGEYNAYPFPLPARLKEYLVLHTHVGRIASRGYVQLMVTTGLSHDFYEHILDSRFGYQTRFSSDLKAIAEKTRELTARAPILIVLDQRPQHRGQRNEIAEIAELSGEEAGFDVVSMEEYRRVYSGQDFSVSKWEGHPNKQAHGIFAEELSAHLIDHPAVQNYIRSQP